jgi:hypothetical protein
VLLLFEGLLHLADYPLNLPGPLFNCALGLQTGIIRQLSCFLLDLALYFVKLAFGLILGAWLHHGCSLGRILGRSPTAIHQRMCPRLLVGAEAGTPVASLLPTIPSLGAARLETLASPLPFLFISRGDSRVCSAWLTGMVTIAQAG